MFSNFEAVYVRRLLCAGLILGASTSLAFADGLMSEVELQKLAPGTYHVEAPSVSLDVRLSKGGLITGRTDKGDQDQGRFRVAGDKLCMKFKKWLDHQEKCERLTQVGTEIKGSVFSVWKH